MDYGLKNKVALITGVGSQIGFGKAIALTLAREGCDIIGADKDLEGAKKTAVEVEAMGRKAIALKADVTSPTEVNDMVKAALAKFGKIDILVNNAGATSTRKPFIEKTEADWDHDININVKGVFNCTRAVLPHMLSRKSGKIINIASGAGRIGLAYQTTYSAAKGGVIAFTKALAREVGPQGINVNGIAPGIGDTNFGRVSKASPESFAQAVAIVPLKRATAPQDIANCVAFLVSEGANYILGQTIGVNGGSTME